MSVARQDPKLLAEIQQALKAERAETEDMMCSGARFGNHWVNLGGERTLPFECQIGKRVLEIDGTVDLLDAKGKVIKGGMDAPNAEKKAAKVRVGNLKWSWKDAPSE